MKDDLNHRPTDEVEAAETVRGQPGLRRQEMESPEATELWSAIRHHTQSTSFEEFQEHVDAEDGKPWESATPPGEDRHPPARRPRWIAWTIALLLLLLALYLLAA